MSKATESIFDGKNVLIPLAEVSYVVKFQNRIEVGFKDSTESLSLVQPDKDAFISAWCRYRGEVEADTLMDLDGAQPAPSIPEGWKLVPIEPTPKMMRAAQKADHDHGDHEEWLEYDGEDVKRVYRAMLAASPEAKP